MSLDTFNPLASSSAPLIAYIDYKSPYAYLAMDPTYAIADELGIEVDWRPFTLDIPSYLGSARLSQEGRVLDNDRTPGQWTKVKYAYHDVRRYGSLRGLVIRGATRMWDSSLTGIGMLWARDQGQAVLRAYSGLVFERFWKRELNPEDAAVIERLLGDASARTAGFQDYARGEGRALHNSIQHAAFEAGIFGVPTYVIDGEMFFGREHLPRIRWMLTGRAGPPPDVSYPDFPTRRAVTGETSKRHLPVVIDFKSPQAYLAIGPTCALADELGVTIDWQPLVVIPSKSAAARPSGDDRGARHRRSRAGYMDRDVARYAADRGLAIEGLDRRKDSTLAAIGLLWAKRYGPTPARVYVQRIFERAGRSELDIENKYSIQAALAEVGATVSGFETFITGEGHTSLARIQSDLGKYGVFEVPTYLLNDDVFLGRQHLPLVRSLLSSTTDLSRA
jgi:2-hydroxychromene-2-carboxylate isomerase